MEPDVLGRRPASLKYGATIDDNGSLRLFYALDSLCLIGNRDLSQAADRRGPDLAGLLGSLREKMVTDDRAESSLMRDLLPSAAFANYLKGQPLERLVQPLEAGAISLSRAADKDTAPAHFAFYAVNLDGLEPHLDGPEAERIRAEDRERLARQQGICQLINLLNLPLVDEAEQFNDERDILRKFGIIGATPNWGFAAQQHFCPSPGSLPRPVASDDLKFEADEAGRPHGRWHFNFALEGDPQLSQGCGVTVAILDTCPTERDLATASATFGDNTLLLEAIGTADSALSLDPATLAQIDPNLRMNLRQYNETQPFAQMSFADHGIFIAGIVRDIAPQADVHLGRVLNGFGISNLRGVVIALDKLANRFAGTFGRRDEERQRLIVNLSLGASLPTGEELLWRWLQSLAGAIAADDTLKAALWDKPEVVEALSDLGTGSVKDENAAARRYLELLRGSVAAILGWLNSHPDVLVVAAAGNDKGLLNSHLTQFTRPEPRWPAQYDVDQNESTARDRDQVIGVAAVNTAGAGTSYSNRGDVAPLVNGVAVWGGETEQHVISTLGEQGLGEVPFPNTPPPVLPSSVDAIKGVYSALTVRDPHDYNQTGWVYWSGTSFAAPIITGLAAQLWSADLSLSPSQVVQRIVKDLPQDNQLPIPQGPSDLFTRVIKASQDWQ